MKRENETLLGDLREGQCSSGLCKQLRSVAADELERLQREVEKIRIGRAHDQNVIDQLNALVRRLERGDRPSRPKG